MTEIVKKSFNYKNPIEDGIYFINKELEMAANQPKKVGQYDRPTRTSKTSTIVIGIVVLIILIILAIILF